MSNDVFGRKNKAFSYLFHIRFYVETRLFHVLVASLVQASLDTCPCNIMRFFFSAVKIENFIRKKKMMFSSKHRLWVQGEAVLTSSSK